LAARRFPIKKPTGDEGGGCFLSSDNFGEKSNGPPRAGKGSRKRGVVFGGSEAELGEEKDWEPRKVETVREKDEVRLGRWGREGGTTWKWKKGIVDLSLSNFP